MLNFLDVNFYVIFFEASNTVIIILNIAHRTRCTLNFVAACD